ncbi:MAG: hypothetical protein RXR20_30160, partial [Paraburkholderia sp.]
MTTSNTQAKHIMPSRLRLRRPLIVLASLGSLGLAAQVQAQALTPPAQVDVQSLIGSGVANGAVGVVAINEASGLDNAQTNQGALTNGPAPLLGLIGSSQSASTNAKTTAARSDIDNNAFSNTSGLIEVN